jgi:hypothetical protein
MADILLESIIAYYAILKAGKIAAILDPSHAKCNSLIVDLDIFRIDGIANKIYKHK